MIKLIGIPRLIPADDMQESTVGELIDWLKDKKEWQFDSETDLNTRNKKSIANPYEQKVLCIQIGDYDNQFLLDPNVVDVQFLKPYFEDKEVCKIMTNASFDLRFLYHYGFKVRNVYDCFLAELSITLGQDRPKGYRGLGQMVERYCGYKLDKTVRGEIQARGLDDTVLRYSAEDVKYMSEIKAKQALVIAELGLENTIRLENRFILTLARISYKGFKVDAKKILQISADNKILCAELKTKLNDFVINLGDLQFLDKQMDLFSEQVTCKINWRSSQQVVALFQKLGINTLVRDKKSSIPGAMKHSVEGKHLSRQKKDFPILVTYLEYKEVEKEISTYGEKFVLDNVNPVTGKMHSEFFPILETGRISSSNPNLQNITATEGGEVSPLRTCFIPEEGNVLIISDYSAQEPRLTAEYSGDDFLRDFIINGAGDSHSLTATAISGFLLGKEIKVSKANNPLVERFQMKIRDIGKIINLGADYGKTAFSVKDDLSCTQEEAQTVMDSLKAKTPQKIAYFKRCAEFVKKNGYIRIDSVTNRISYFPEWEEYKQLETIPYDDKTKEQRSKYFKLRGMLERGGQNRPIQGSAGGMTKIACILFEDKIEKLGLNAWIANQVHDELIVECSKDIQEQVKSILEEAMIESGQLFCKVIPTKVETYVGTNWGAKH